MDSVAQWAIVHGVAESYMKEATEHAPLLRSSFSNMGRGIENQPNHNLVLIFKKKSHLESLLGQRYSVQYLLTLYLQITNQTQSMCEKHMCTHPLTTQVLFYCKLIMERLARQLEPRLLSQASPANSHI